MWIDLAALIAELCKTRKRELHRGVPIDEPCKAVSDHVDGISDAYAECGFSKGRAITRVVTALATCTTWIPCTTVSVLGAVDTRVAKNARRSHSGLVLTVYGNNSLRHTYPHYGKWLLAVENCRRRSRRG